MKSGSTDLSERSTHRTVFRNKCNLYCHDYITRYPNLFENTWETNSMEHYTKLFRKRFEDSQNTMASRVRIGARNRN